jgi:hypothetical protein
LASNRFNGTIPTHFAQLTKLSYLYVVIVRGGVFVSILVHVRVRRFLHTNQLTGTIPTQVAQLTVLRDLYVVIVPDGVSCPFRFTASLQVLVHQSPRRTDSSVELDNYQLVSDAVMPLPFICLCHQFQQVDCKSQWTTPIAW